MAFPLLDANTKDWVQVASWAVAIAAGLFGVFRILVEVRQNRLQRVQELRWKKAEAAKALIDQMRSDAPALAAMRMLDWNGREFEIKPSTLEMISKAQMLRALRTSNLQSTDTATFNRDAFVRDAFDGLLHFLGMFEHYIARELVEFLDVQNPSEYYVTLMAEDRAVFANYMREYGFTRAARFVARSQTWRDADAAPHPPGPNHGLQPPAGA